jgi:hypothetical protein
MTETKNQRFQRLAQKRTINALKCIESLSNLSNKNNYEYSEQEYKVIVKALKAAVADLEKAFLANKSSAKDEFISDFNLVSKP